MFVGEADTYSVDCKRRALILCAQEKYFIPQQNENCYQRSRHSIPNCLINFKRNLDNKDRNCKTLPAKFQRRAFK